MVKQFKVLDILLIQDDNIETIMWNRVFRDDNDTKKIKCEVGNCEITEDDCLVLCDATVSGYADTKIEKEYVKMLKRVEKWEETGYCAINRCIFFSGLNNPVLFETFVNLN